MRHAPLLLLLTAQFSQVQSWTLKLARPFAAAGPSRSFLRPGGRHLCTGSVAMSSSGISGNHGRLAFRVVTYNVLTPNYAQAWQLPTLPPENLDETRRLNKVLVKLDEQVQTNAIICLQEVNRVWAGHLHCWFAQRGYYFVQSCYGRPSSGYFGVGMAWPRSRFVPKQMCIQRIADCKEWSKIEPASVVATAARRVTRAVKGLGSVLMTPLLRIVQMFGGEGRIPLLKGSRSDPAADMDAARSKDNTAIIVEFKDVSTDKTFVVSTYHMPCEYRRPRIMTVHTALYAQRVHSFANGRPYVITGDFNFRPDWPQYQLLTKGWIADNSPDYPVLPHGDTWRPRVEATLRSALATKWGKEPEFTNHALVDKVTGERFIDTLDYIFVSGQWHVSDASKHITKEEALALPYPFPDENEPSDHLLIHADLSCDF